MDCSKIKLKKGSSGTQVKELQTALQKLGYYTAKIDGSFGSITETAVKNFQKKYNLVIDGWVGSETCKKLQQLTSNNDKSYSQNGVYYSNPHWISKGCNKLGQCNGYYCGVHCIRQCNSKMDIDSYSEALLAKWAGTTTAGTSHKGLETAIAKVAKEENRKISVQWKNFSDCGDSTVDRFKKIGEIICQKNKDIIFHVAYKYKFGHYETIKTVNLNNYTVTVLNSLGSKCSSQSYCGNIETRSFTTMVGYMKGISQKSVCILTYE